MELFRLKYKEEATELIDGMERSLLLMESDMDDPALMEDVFRNMHTLKGNSSMLGFTLIADFTHNLESIYELIRSGNLKMSRQIIDITFSAMDHLSALISNEGILSVKEQILHDQLSAKVNEMIFGTDHHMDNNANDKYPDHTLQPFSGNESLTYHIRFYPGKDLLLNGSNPLLLVTELYEYGECSVSVNTNDIPQIEHCDADSCYTSWDIYLTTNADIKKIREVFSFVEHKCSLGIKSLPKNSPHAAFKIVPGSPEGELKATPPVPEAIPVNKQILQPAAFTKNQLISSIRVPSERLDNLMSLVSELITLQAKLGTITEQHPQLELLAVSENLEKISTRLRDNAFNMCLVPISNMITPFHRLVRDLAAELHKEIEFITEGTATELDKNIMEGLSDPLMHLLRNSIDHGIEDPQERVRAGKPRQGKITIRSFCAGTNVYVEVHDDGKGIDIEKVKNKAIEKGLIDRKDSLTEKEVLNLIFLPGFSTAEKVSGISGRGVGMDVVKRKIADIRGQIKINTQINTGTVITIRLPITTSIIDGLLVKINGADFVIPLSSVERCYEVRSANELNRFTNLVILDGEQIPFISLSEEFDGIDNFTTSREIVIVSYDDRKVGLIVDQVVGKFQAVLKPLGRYFRHMENISGATILGDGNIALVLDTNNVTEQYLNKKSTYTYQ